MKNHHKYFKSISIFLLSSLFIIFSPKQTIFLFMLIVLIFHELGHLFFMSLFNVKITSFSFSIIGGLIDVKMNLDIKYELIIYLGGIIFNLFTLLFPHLYFYSLIIIIFNLLPIYPLDGFNIYKRIISYFINYHKTLYVCYLSSIIINIILIIFSIIYLNAILIINLLYTLVLTIIRFKEIHNEFYSFLLDKYLNKDKNKIKYLYQYIKYPYYKYHSAIIYDNGRIITDRNLLDNRFAIRENK